MRLHHLAFRSRRLEALVSFYRDIVGLVEDRRSLEPNGALRSVWLLAGDARVMLEAANEHEPDVPAGTLELAAFEATPIERESVVARLDRAGVAVEARTEHTVYFRDPDGRRVALSSFPW